MTKNSEHIIYTIGHSTHTAEAFLAMLQSFEIKTLVDIRSLPGSNKFPQFNQETLQTFLEENGIQYVYLSDLGGRRKFNKDSKNTAWRSHSFRAYADYMETENFHKGIAELQRIAEQQTTVFMCAEAVWWRCHRAMVSDYLKAKGWTVLHIMAVGKVEEHPYTSPAKIVNGEVVYTEEHENMNTEFKIGDHVKWNSEAGMVSGTIIKIHTQDFDYKGYTHHASPEEPQYEIKSDKTSHIAAHKGKALTKMEG